MSNGGRSARKDNMKNPIKRLGALTVTGAILAASLVTGIALPASAQTEECVPREAYTETINHPAVGEPTITVENPNYVPAVEYQPAVYGEPPLITPAVEYQPAVYEVEYKFVHKFDFFHLKPKWKTDPNWNAESNPHSKGWVFTGETRQGALISPEVPAQAAVYGEPPLITPEVLAQDAQGEPTIEVENPDYVPAWSEPVEHPAVTCDPVVVPPTNVQCDPVAGPVGTNLNGLWGNVDTRSAGHYEYVDGGLHVWTDNNSSEAKVSLGTPASFPLSGTGTLSIDWTGSTPPPGLNLFVNFGADGAGTLVYESVYGQDLWLTNGSSAAVKANAPVNGGGNGSQWHGTIDQWLSVYPEAQVVGIAFSLGSGVLGDGTINSITAGCQVYTFDFAEEQQPPVEEPEEPTDPVTPTPVPEEPEEPKETVTPTPAATPAASADTLAETGNDAGVWLVAGILGVLLVGAGATLAIRRRNSRV